MWLLRKFRKLALGVGWQFCILAKFFVPVVELAVLFLITDDGWSWLGGP